MENSKLVFWQILPPSKQMHHHAAFLLGPKINYDLWFFHPALKTLIREATHCYEADTLTTTVVLFRHSFKHLIAPLYRPVITAVPSVPKTVNVSSKLILRIASYMSPAISQLFPPFLEM